MAHGLYHTISRHWLLMASGWTHGHTHTRIPTRGPKQFQETRRAQPKAVRAWFKNLKVERSAMVLLKYNLTLDFELFTKLDNSVGKFN